MADSSERQVTALLKAWRGGERGALARLLPLVYAELRRLAASHMRAERADHTLQPTALVHEAYLRLVDQSVDWQNRSHFFGIASQMMRRILVDHARRRQAAKRDAPVYRLAQPERVAAPDRDPELLSLDRALGDLEALDPRQARIVELRFFGGLGVEETAEVVGVSSATVKREWRTARAWLRREIGTPPP